MQVGAEHREAQHPANTWQGLGFEDSAPTYVSTYQRKPNFMP
jgi:hypothetical protein